MESEILSAGGLSEDSWHICLSRTKEYTFSLEQGKLFPHKVAAWHSCVACYLLGRKCSSPRPFYMAERRVEKTAHETAFPSKLSPGIHWKTWTITVITLIMLFLSSSSGFLQLYFRVIFYNCPALLGHLLPGHKPPYCLLRNISSVF